MHGKEAVFSVDFATDADETVNNSGQHSPLLKRRRFLKSSSCLLLSVSAFILSISASRSTDKKGRYH